MNPTDNPNQDVTRLLDSASGKVTDWEKKQHRRLVAEKLRRECEALRVYEPLDFQEEFHRCTAQQALIQKGNRTGGSTALMVEVARAFTDQDPHNKYPKRGGRIVLLGYGEKHIGRVFYDKLFRAGAFKIIRDKDTGKWRVYRPWADSDRESESKPAPPLIPQRFIEGKISWEKRSERVFSVVRSTVDWEIYATNSAGDPGQAQGFSVNLYGIDEDLATSGWYEEAVGRIADCGGFIRWSALPHAKNDDLMQLVSLAEKEAEKPEPTAVIIRSSIFDNKYLPRQSVENSVTAWKSQGDDIYRKRALGEININSTLMYPSFSKNVHDVMTSPTLVEDQQYLAANNGKIPDDWTAPRILAARMGEPPDDWTRYVSIDPGSTVLAIEFLAVPPEQLGDQIFLYDESYIRDPSVPTEAFGDAMQMKCSDRVIQAFIFDMHGGRLRSIATGQQPVTQYQSALEVRGVKSVATGHGFRHAFDDRKQREEDMRSALAIRRDGQPRLMIVAGKCPSFVWEMERFKKKVVKQWGKEVPIDEGDRRVGTHAIDAIEGAIALDLPYIKPRKQSLVAEYINHFKSWGDRMRRRENGQAGESQHISLGPIGVES